MQAFSRPILEVERISASVVEEIYHRYFFIFLAIISHNLTR